jgi:hypothetical protein
MSRFPEKEAIIFVPPHGPWQIERRYNLLRGLELRILFCLLGTFGTHSGR